ncbi:hypothetical protein BZA77DRAFT_296528 [Pyronema omphalodes]|nr:hypothetical protein BZA77DRAFT_296528 [Pyronema omphalodes]
MYRTEDRCCAYPTIPVFTARKVETLDAEALYQSLESSLPWCPEPSQAHALWLETYLAWALTSNIRDVLTQAITRNDPSTSITPFTTNLEHNTVTANTKIRVISQHICSPPKFPLKFPPKRILKRKRRRTRDKNRNTMHKYKSEVHLSDPSSTYSHIRIIPAPDRTSQEEKQAPPGSFVLASANATPKVPALAGEPGQVTFASKLKASINDSVLDAEPDSRPIFGDIGTRPNRKGHQTSGSTSNFNNFRTENSSTTNSNPNASLRSAKVVFAPRNVKQPESVGALMQQYGIRKDGNGQEQPLQGPNITAKGFQANGTAKQTHSQENISQHPSLSSQHQRKTTTEKQMWAPAKSQFLKENQTPDSKEAMKKQLHDLADKHQENVSMPGSHLVSPLSTGSRSPTENGVHRSNIPQPPVDYSGRRGGISFSTPSNNSRVVTPTGPTAMSFHGIPTGPASQTQQNSHESLDGTPTAKPVPKVHLPSGIPPQGPKSYIAQRYNTPESKVVEMPAVKKNAPFPASWSFLPEDTYVGSELEAKDNERIYKMKNRNNILHRLETLQLASTSNETAVNFPSTIRLGTFPHHSLAAQPSRAIINNKNHYGLSCLNGGGTLVGSQNPTLEDLRNYYSIAFESEVSTLIDLYAAGKFGGAEIVQGDIQKYYTLLAAGETAGLYELFKAGKVGPEMLSLEDLPEDIKYAFILRTMPAPDVLHTRLDIVPPPGLIPTPQTFDGRTRMKVYSEAEIALLREQTLAREKGIGMDSGALPNPTILPYAVSSVPKDQQMKEIFNRAFENIRDFKFVNRKVEPGRMVPPFVPQKQSPADPHWRNYREEEALLRSYITNPNDHVKKIQGTEDRTASVAARNVDGGYEISLLELTMDPRRNGQGIQLQERSSEK